MSVLTLAMRFIILTLMLASGPEPKAGSYDEGERFTRRSIRISQLPWVLSERMERWESPSPASALALLSGLEALQSRGIDCLGAPDRRRDGKKLTPREESVFGENRDSVNEKDRNCRKDGRVSTSCDFPPSSSFTASTPLFSRYFHLRISPILWLSPRIGRRLRRTVEEASEEEHFGRFIVRNLSPSIHGRN